MRMCDAILDLGLGLGLGNVTLLDLGLGLARRGANFFVWDFGLGFFRIWAGSMNPFSKSMVRSPYICRWSRGSVDLWYVSPRVVCMGGIDVDRRGVRWTCGTAPTKKFFSKMFFYFM